MTQQLLNAVVLGSVYTLFALGLSLTWGTLNILNLAHGATFMFGAFSGYVALKSLDVNLLGLVIGGAVIGGAMSVLLHVCVFRPIQRRVEDPHKAELAMLIASVGAATIPLSIAQRETSDQPFGFAGATSESEPIRFGGVYISHVGVVIVVLTIVLTVGLALWVMRTQSGRALRALAFDPETCGLMGINQNRLMGLTLLISGATAGVGGVLLCSYLGSITPMTGETLLLKGFACVILGGVGSIWGTAAGAVILAVAETYSTATTSGAYTEAISFAIIVVILFVRPQGLFVRAKVDRV